MFNISKNKDNQTMKFDPVPELSKEIFFFKNHAENEAGRLVYNLSLIFEKAFYELKASDLQLNFKIS